MMAILSNDPWLMEVMSDPDVDIHGIMAEQLYGDLYINADPNLKKELRNIAKMFVFGLGYGREAPSIARQMTSLALEAERKRQKDSPDSPPERVTSTPIGEAQELMNRFFAPMPVLKSWMREIVALGVGQGYLENIFGRRRRFELITDARDVEKQMLNVLPQGNANDLNLSTMLRIYKKYWPLVKPLWPIHDSIMFNVSNDIRLEQLEDVLDIMRQHPQSLMETNLPFFIDIDVGHIWGALSKYEGRVPENLHALAS